MSSRVNWRLEPSDDEGSHDAHDTEAAVRKRSSRACDQCRKSKSKCERPTDGNSCKNCSAAGIPCTFLGPSYKRGPPKGYINAIEHRWHMVESLLGAIISSPDPRSQGIVADLRKDELARDILDRVTSGPFGPSGRSKKSTDPNKEDFFVSFFSGEASSARDRSRPRRQSRVSREIVSSREEGVKLPVPTMDWQDRLSSRLAASRNEVPSSSFRFQNIAFPDSSKRDHSGAPRAQRRRTDRSEGSTDSWRGYSHDMLSDSSSDTSEEVAENGENFGQLSLDENSEVRFHGSASGLQPLARIEREDSRVEGGIWRFPMSGIWPRTENHVINYHDEEMIDVQMPEPEKQDRLIALYFAYAHSACPVIQTTQFMEQYRERRRTGETSPTFGPQRGQSVSKLLLFAIFSIATRYIEPVGNEDTCVYTESARLILNKIYHHSRPSTCQALLLLGVRSLGIGSYEAAWLYVGMAIRMAQDLGLNRNGDNWKYNGSDLFSHEEKQFRKQVWWCCCLVDKYSCVHMGRPPMIDECDFDNPLPEVDEAIDEELWHRLEPGTATNEYPPVPSRMWSYFRASSALSVIVGNILRKMYAMRSKSRHRLKTKLAELEQTIDQWYLSLPEDLRYDSVSKRTPPPPHILTLHAKYHAAKLLLYSTILPLGQPGSDIVFPDKTDTVSLKAFDHSQTAACHISNIVSTFDRFFNMKYCSPLLTHNVFVAGSMHVVTLKLRPSNPQASMGYEQCIDAIKGSAKTWSSAQRVVDLLNNVKLEYERVTGNLLNPPIRHKRPRDDLGGGKSSDFLQREAFGGSPEPARSGSADAPDTSKRIMANMLGLDVPGVEPSTSFFPGYEWWPRSPHGRSPPAAMEWPRDSDAPPADNIAPTTPGAVITHPRIVDWQQGYQETFAYPGSSRVPPQV